MLIFPIIITFFGFASGKELVYEDHIYEDNIKTVRLYPASDDPDIKMLPAVTSMGGANLQVEFDDLQDDRTNYYAKILHCNYNWTPSRLHDLDYIADYNEFNINDYTYSSNTHIPYVHYRFLIPKVKLPGNYLLIIYRDGDKEDLIISRRFMVSSNVVSLIHESNFGMSTLKATNQQINFVLDYNRVNITNPLETVNAVIRQNQRWDNAQVDIKPSFINESKKTMEYRFFNNEKSFQAGNEFRFVDFASLNSPGQNTGHLLRDKKPYQLYVATDVPRDGQRYAQYKDLNGSFIISNYDAGEGDISGNYLNVIFTLPASRPYKSKIYVMGSFNNWVKESTNEMTYSQGQYTCNILLKQGIYDYCYQPESESESVEGNYYETENQYEIFVYNHSFYPDADMLIGYYNLRVNPR